MKTLICALLVPVLILALGTTVLAEVSNGGGATVPLDSSGRYILTEGVYNAEGQINYPVVTKGQVELNLSNADIDMSATELPAITVEEGSLSLILSGESKVQGGKTMAGVYVAPGTELIISGKGQLEAFGGNGKEEDPIIFGGGAGIGGNGIVYDEDADKLYVNPGFGTVTIEEGTLIATGGKAVQADAGAGAGIGSGGMGGAYDDDAFPLQGKIIIKEGTINAYGGDEIIEAANTLGGAGIGSGGIGNGNGMSCDNQMVISIYGGTVKANGGIDGAGIGGGANCDSGDIVITGGIIEARGGYEVDTNNQQTGISGGAGIGGGDMAGVTNVRISGNAQVTAFGGGSAAGIGGGKDGVLYGMVDIAGSAKVWAHGGSAYHTTYEIYFGGAGIGAGSGRYMIPSAYTGAVSITEDAFVRAYAGKRAQAIGVGSYFTRNGRTYGSYFKTVKFRDNIDIWMFNQDDVQPAFWGQTADGQALDPTRYTADGLITAWYTNPIDATEFPADGKQVVTSTYPVQENIFWKKLGQEIRISRVANMIANDTAPFEPGNWGTLIKPITPDQPSTPSLPRTGDDANPLLWFALMACSCAAWLFGKKAMRAHG